MHNIDARKNSPRYAAYKFYNKAFYTLNTCKTVNNMVIC